MLRGGLHDLLSDVVQRDVECVVCGNNAGHLGLGKIVISRVFSWNGGESERPLDSSRVHQAGLMLEIDGLDNPWGGEPEIFNVVTVGETYTGTVSHCTYRIKATKEWIDADGDKSYTSYADESPSYSGCYLRGGGLKYRIVTSWGYTVAFQDGSESGGRTVLHDHGNSRWVVTPLNWADRVAPVTRFAALSNVLLNLKVTLWSKLRMGKKLFPVLSIRYPM